MPQMSSTDATFHAAQGLIFALHNSAPVNPIVKLVNVHKKALSTLENIFRKATPPHQYLRGYQSGGNSKRNSNR